MINELNMCASRIGGVNCHIGDFSGISARGPLVPVRFDKAPHVAAVPHIEKIIGIVSHVHVCLT